MERVLQLSRKGSEEEAPVEHLRVAKRMNQWLKVAAQLTPLAQNLLVGLQVWRLRGPEQPTA